MVYNIRKFRPEALGSLEVNQRPLKRPKFRPDESPIVESDGGFFIGNYGESVEYVCPFLQIHSFHPAQIMPFEKVIVPDIHEFSGDFSEHGVVLNGKYLN